MFGVVRPCRHRLHGPLFGRWMAHLCGLCLTLRDVHGQSARLVTNYDGLLVSVLAEAQEPGSAPHRQAGPCALRGFRRADVVSAAAPGARLAAAVSLVLAAGKLRDHVADGDGPFARGVAASAGRLAARRWESAARQAGRGIGFDTEFLTAAIARQISIERTGSADLLEVTEPAEFAVGAAFGQTADLAGRPHNRQALEAAGRGFGRIAHLLDAAEDLWSDTAAGLYNPLQATGTSLAEARDLCGRSVDVMRTAVAELDLEDRALTEALLVREVQIAVDAVFTAAGAGSAGRRPPASRPGPLRLLDLPCLAGQHNPPGQWPGDRSAAGPPLQGWQQDPVPGQSGQQPGQPGLAPGRPRGGCCGDCCSDAACDACCDGAECCSACDCSC